MWKGPEANPSLESELEPSFLDMAQAFPLLEQAECGVDFVNCFFAFHAIRDEKGRAISVEHSRRFGDWTSPGFENFIPRMC